jgi:hypothetical protein
MRRTLVPKHAKPVGTFLNWSDLKDITLRLLVTLCTAALTCTLVPVHAQSIAVRTATGISAGIQISSYKYQETDANNGFFMSLEGGKLGAIGTVTQALGDNWYIVGDARFAGGNANYTSVNTGSKGGNPDRYLDLRFLAGKDFEPGGIVLSPFSGLGYRTLYSDLTGYTSTGAVGYRRASRYTYIPLGMTHRFKVNDQARISTTLEYDYLFEGNQRSYMTDIAGNTGDLDNSQRNGYGLRLNMTYETVNWSVGAFYHFWNIQDSDLGTYTDATLIHVAYEPHNTTTELGVQLKYNFR